MPVRRSSPSKKAAFEYTRRASARYAAALRRIAAHIGHLAESAKLDDPASIAAYANLMHRYSEILKPWARAQGAKMLAEVDRRDTKYWFEYSRRMGQAIKHELANAPTGAMLMQRREKQVGLITSLPLDAAARVNAIATQSIYSGQRPEELAKQILRTGEVTKARANLIARTETSTAASEFTRIRSKAIGSTGYIWRTVGDGRVRDSHQHMEGEFISWDKPPRPEGKERYHAGCIYNCRCWPEPVLPDEEFFNRDNSIYGPGYLAGSARERFKAELVHGT
jgi:SPP1 gp7 family putative phage head morphogenesis protein